ncbi:hypothetical protein H6G06_23545 [Anabaena sphaerica FACHB-251]|uniref:Uncharacterized protein n=1 Tax=Anabaena sphaerica FACHB-251 TaxID=2692883 RepID=A0A927A3P9_9NOST|nr:hypothetical protein [Anabaena sphaerica]MBD2296376.1 hypothetical protein [Anabaena sphaerica FACHB-251]
MRNMYMGSRQLTKNNKIQGETLAPTSGMFEGRSLAVQGKVEKPDFKTSLMRAERYGHHLGQIHLPSVSTPKAIQSKKGSETLQETQIHKGQQVIQRTPNKKPRPKSWHEMDRTAQNPEFQKSLGIMREALNIDPAHRNDPKIGFPFSHFDHAFGTNQKEESVKVKGGVEHKKIIQTPNETTDVERIMPMLPTSLTQGGHLEHQLRQGDAAKASSSSDSQNKVTMDRVREAAVGTKFAHDTGLSLDKLHQPSAEIDFQSETPSGKKVQFDPFTSPQSKKPTTKQLLGQQLLEEGTLTQKELPNSYKQTPVKRQQQEGMDKKWVNDAFTKHTNQSKGDGVIGLWDQTSDSQPRVNELQQRIQDQPRDFKPRLQNVDLKLDEEYVKEDMQAQRDLAKRRRRKSI